MIILGCFKLGVVLMNFSLMFWSEMLHAQPFRKDVLRVERLEKLPAAAV